jgi:hypothetical protein
VNVIREWRLGARACALGWLALLAGTANAQNGDASMPPPQSGPGYSYVPKQVHLVFDRGKLFASNVKFNRFDELRLSAGERVVDQQVGAAVAVVITTQRIAAYGVMSGWRSLDRMPSEQVESVTAEDYGGLIVTSARMLNFNGQNGVFAERKRTVAN